MQTLLEYISKKSTSNYTETIDINLGMNYDEVLDRIIHNNLVGSSIVMDLDDDCDIIEFIDDKSKYGLAKQAFPNTHAIILVYKINSRNVFRMTFEENPGVSRMHLVCVSGRLGSKLISNSQRALKSLNEFLKEPF